MNKDNIQDDPNYGKPIDLWIYTPVKKEWVQIQDPTFFKSVIFDVNDKAFMQSLYWLNIGAMFFEHGTNPNEVKHLVPICFPDQFCRQHGIMQDNLKEAMTLGNLAVIERSESARNVSSEAMLARKQKAIDDLKQKAEQIKPKFYTTAEIVERLKQDWQTLSFVGEQRLKLIERQHKIERDGDKVRIV